jgi:hypothetical protein
VLRSFILKKTGPTKAIRKSIRHLKSLSLSTLVKVSPGCRLALKAKCNHKKVKEAEKKKEVSELDTEILSCIHAIHKIRSQLSSEHSTPFELSSKPMASSFCV